MHELHESNPEQDIGEVVVTKMSQGVAHKMPEDFVEVEKRDRSPKDREAASRKRTLIAGGQ